MWAEGALFVPAQTVNLTEDLSALGMGIQQSVALSTSPYFKFVVGADYTFQDNLYLNVQFLHGFLQERGEANLQDYVIADLDWTVLDGKLKLSPIAAILEIKDWQDVPNNYAIIAAPSLTVRPFDNATVTVGFHWIQGTSTTTFGQMSGDNEVFITARYSF